MGQEVITICIHCEAAFPLSPGTCTALPVRPVSPDLHNVYFEDMIATTRHTDSST
jgi:hypothetical protein